jgi:hypothetical protein
LIAPAGLPPPAQPFNNGTQEAIQSGSTTQNPTNDGFAQEAEREVQKALQSFLCESQNNSGNHQQQNGGMLRLITKMINN